MEWEGLVQHANNQLFLISLTVYSMEGYVKVGVGVATVGVVAGLIGLAIYTYKRCKKRKSIIRVQFPRK